MSILLYIGMGLFVFSFSGLRQMFAIIFGLFAIEKLMNKKYISWALLIVIAFLFHKSAIVLIATLPLTWLRIRPKHLLVIIPIMLIIIFFARDIAVVLIKLTVPKYLNYVDSGSGYGLFGVFLSILYCVCLVVTYRNNCTNKDSFIRNLALMACMIQLFGNISTVTGRITLYFIIYFALLIPTASNQVSKDRPTEKIINFAMISFIMATLFVQTLLSGYLDISPYKFFWQ